MATIQLEQVPDDILVVKKKRKRASAKKPKKDRSLRAMFRELLANLDIESLKKPWMATKSFRLISTEADLVAWVDSILNDPSRWFAPYAGAEPCPVIATDTETLSLDTRVMIDMKQLKELSAAERELLTPYQKALASNGLGEEAWVPIFNVKSEMAGICLSPDGISGIYVPMLHENCQNVPREVIARELQRLFDRAHLVFYNAKFDREVLRLTLGLRLRDYPYFEDIQGLHFINDPKAQLDEKKYSGDSGGLQARAEEFLGYEMIKLDTIGKVSADWWNEEKQKFTKRVQHVPFTWIPTAIALWYAAADAICTWALWWKWREEAQSRKRVHNIDGHLVDTLTWIERQRWLINAEEHRRMVSGHIRSMAEKREALSRLAVEHGWVEEFTDDGKVIPESRFNVNSGPNLQNLLFGTKQMTVVKRTPKGAPSLDADALIDLRKMYPADKFLLALEQYKEFVALHPESLSYEPSDSTARIFLKQNTVAGGRLAAAGGDFIDDGGLGLNPQAIKGVDKLGMWKVTGRVLTPDYIEADRVVTMPIEGLDDSCFRLADPEKDKLFDQAGNGVAVEALEVWADAARREGWVQREGREGWWKVAPGIVGNHILNILGYAVCLQKDCKRCDHEHGTLIERGTLDANGILNFRRLFIAMSGWTAVTTDYSNIEMRVAANESREPKFIKEFLEGSGDFHTLTASTVFAEFNDPATSKERKKELRSIAKIMNFQLLYGGSEITVYENAKKILPHITMEDAKKWVADYWDGVPVFSAYCDNLQRIAREQMTCTTAIGRVIKFQSQMDALGIHVPTKEEQENRYQYYRIRNKFREAEANGDNDLALQLKGSMGALYCDADTGVRNAIEHNQFMGKIERVSVNVPLQGLAGDIMRMALNRIRKWATLIEPMVQSVLRVHSSVHDEVDYAVKDPYMPFVVPRITRLMKLRKLHELRKWPVGIECDTEYGKSWDVDFHLTGGDGKKPAGWTDVPGMAEYLPEGFERETIEALIRAMLSGKETSRQRAWDALVDVLHPRAVDALKYAFYVKDKEPQTDPRVVRKQLFATLHLDEFWRVDETPDDADDQLETMAQYEARCGLTEADRGFMPEGGFLGAIPLGLVYRPEVPILGPPPEPEPTPDAPLPLFDAEHKPTPAEERHEKVQTAMVDLAIEEQEQTEAVETDQEHLVETLWEGEELPEPPPIPEPGEDLLAPLPKKRVVAASLPEPKGPKVFVLRPQAKSNIADLRLALGWGDCEVRVRFADETAIGKISGIGRPDVPAEFCVEEPIHV